MALAGRRIVVGVGGGIAAFKAVELVRELGRRGAEVRVVLTPAGARFVGAVTFAGLTGRPAVTDLWDPTYAGEVHVELGAWADAIVVAPATMNVLARAAQGFADDALLATIACARGAVLYAPAMHTRMWERPATQRNVARLREDGAAFVGPVSGPLASGESGEGRMSEPLAIADALETLLGGAGDLAGVHLVATAGPTVEDLDPVRFLGNRSSGKMGYAIAERAVARGARVTLISGPVAIDPPRGVELVSVRSALDMKAAVDARFDDADVIVMAAAVADYRPAAKREHKIKKTDGPVSIELARNPDILADLGARRRDRRPVLVGFAVETQDLETYARKKLTDKRCDLVVANHASIGFGGDQNQAVLVDSAGAEALPPMDKRALADRVLDRARALLG